MKKGILLLFIFSIQFLTAQKVDPKWMQGIAPRNIGPGGGTASEVYGNLQVEVSIGRLFLMIR